MVETLAVYLGVSTQHPGQFFYAAYGAAIDRMRDLLASLDEAVTAQARPGGDPPHAYIPAGPVEAAPYEGYCPRAGNGACRLRSAAGRTKRGARPGASYRQLRQLRSGRGHRYRDPGAARGPSR